MRNIDCERLKQAVDEHTGADVLSGRVLGGAISVFQNGTTVYQACIGHADVAKTRPVTSETVFRLASMTKPITAAVTMAMVDRGRISLDDPISKYLPYMEHLRIGKINEAGEVCITGEARTPITARHILTHTSGIGSGALFTHFYRTTPPQVMKTLSASVEWYASLPLSFEPFTTFEYSGTAAFDTLAHALERIADMRYEELVKKLILDPCEMADTTFEPTAEQWGRMIEMHDYCNGQAASSPTVSGCVFENYPTTHPAAGAGLISTLDDYSHFAGMLLDGGCYGKRRVLSNEAVGTMTSAQAPILRKDGASRWGLGGRVITSEQYGALPVGTYGWSGAYGTHFWIDPANRIYAIYLKNSRYDGGSGNKTGKQLEWDVANALL